MLTPYLPFTTFLNHADDIPQIVVHLHTRLTHTLNRLTYHITMFYNSIILALTAVQVLAQDQYTPDDLNDYGTTIEGTTADPSPTAAPYVPIQSDGTPSNEGASNYTYNGADPSLIADTSIPVNNASAASSVVTSLYTSDASQAGSSASQSSSASSASANSGQTTTPPSTPEAWQHIIYKADTSKCLAVFDTSGNVNTPVV
jgi:hypothetical protein